MSGIEKLNIKDLPIMPQVAAKILQLQEDNLQISFKELEQAIRIDPALTAKILKVSNSALYSRQREITSLQQAITLLGFKVIKSLVLLVCASNLFAKSGTTKRAELGLWRHLILTSFVSKAVASKLSRDGIKENVFIGGLLHDIGRVILILNFNDKYADFLEMVKDSKKTIFEIEEEIFGFNHCALGKQVLEQWNFPEEFVDIVSQHHEKNIVSKTKEAVLIVALGNIYARILLNEPLKPEDLELKEYYIKSLSITPDDDEYFSTKLIDDLQKDELYAMSSSILG